LRSGNPESPIGRRAVRPADGPPPISCRTLQREVAWILGFKLVALLLLWALFFSPEHRRAVDNEATSRRFAVMPACEAIPNKECKENNGE
jgi:hypothetical protein